MKIMVNFLTIFVMMITISATAQLKVGDTLPSITLESSTNSKISLSNFNGRLLLIDFWASWCGPCRLANKKLVKLHAALDNNLIKIIGISVDTDHTKWLKAIEKDKIQFTQLIDPEGFNANSAVVFGVDELPSKFLFNEKGVLIAINPSEEEIIKYLK